MIKYLEKNILVSSSVNEISHDSAVSSGMMSLTPGHVGHLPAPQAAAYWHPAAGGAYEASLPRN